MKDCAGTNLLIWVTLLAYVIWCCVHISIFVNVIKFAREYNKATIVYVSEV